jgi:hypothetical protein
MPSLSLPLPLLLFTFLYFSFLFFSSPSTPFLVLNKNDTKIQIYTTRNANAKCKPTNANQSQTNSSPHPEKKVAQGLPLHLTHATSPLPSSSSLLFLLSFLLVLLLVPLLLLLRHSSSSSSSIATSIGASRIRGRKRRFARIQLFSGDSRAAAAFQLFTQGYRGITAEAFAHIDHAALALAVAAAQLLAACRQRVDQRWLEAFARLVALD